MLLHTFLGTLEGHHLRTYRLGQVLLDRHVTRSKYGDLLHYVLVNSILPYVLLSLHVLFHSHTLYLAAFLDVMPETYWPKHLIVIYH
jgi:hypothetical protein